MSETTYYQRNRDVILNRAKDYFKNDKERLRKNKERIWKKEISQYVRRKKNKDEKNIQKIIVRLKSLNLVINKLVFNYINLIVHANHDNIRRKTNFE